MLTIAEIRETITEESAAAGDVASSEMTDPEPITFRDALDVIRNGVWDSEDWRATEVILYPADWHQDIRTGEYDATTVVIRATTEHQLARLLAALDPPARWVVVENTPGYLPEDDDPATFADIEDAKRYLAERVAEYVEHVTSEPDDPEQHVTFSDDGLSAYVEDDTPHGLGRVFEVLPIED